MERRKILNFGSVNLDYVYQVSHFVTPGETLAANRMSMNPGGKGLNQSVALAKAGAAVWHAGCVGKGGRWLKDFLREQGVDVTYLIEVGEMQGNAMIQVNEQGENCILLYGGSNRVLQETQIADTLEQFKQGDFLVLQNEINRLPEIIEQGYANGMRIVLNPSPFEESLRNLDYGKISWLLINEVEAQQITGRTEPDSVRAWLKERYPDLQVVLTLGEKGACCYAKGETIYQPAYKTNAVDTTAAGDTFTGYFLEALSGGRPLRQCMNRAALASGISVSRRGAAESIPCKAEVDELLKQTFDGAEGEELWRRKRN